MEKVKANWKLIAIVILAVIVLFQVKKCHQDKTTIYSLQHLVNFNDSSSYSTIKRYQDDAFRFHNIAFTQTIYSQMLGDSIARLLKIKPKQIETASKTISHIEIHDKWRVDTIWEDKDNDGTPNVKQFNVAYDDPWNHISGTVGDYIDSVNYSGVDTLSRVDYWKRKKILGLEIGAKVYYADFNNANERIETVGYKGVRIGEKSKHFSIGPSIQVTYPLKVSAGISLQYSLFKF